MFVTDYIAVDYPVFKVTDVCTGLYEKLESTGYSHLFLVDNEVFYIAALALRYLKTDKKNTLADYRLFYEKFAIHQSYNLLDSFKFFSLAHTNILPIIDEKERYLGYFSMENLVDIFAKYPMFGELAHVLVIQSPNRRHSFNEITKIAESCQCKVLACMLIDTQVDASRICLKIGEGDMSTLEDSLKRYGYLIINKSYQDVKEDLKAERFGYLKKFIEI